jgi:predicted transposase/invertase (TIGR01784 family)
MNNTFLSPLNDYVVKSIFGDQRNIENTEALLKAALDIPPEDFGKLTIVDPFLNRIWRKDKLGILDIRLTTTSGKVINVEVQVERHKSMIKRIIYYLAKLLIEQMKSGFNYEKINQTICVVIVDHILCPEERHYLNSYELRNPLTGRPFTDLLKVVIIELPKVPETDDGQAIWPWLRFFKSKTREELTMLTKTHPEVKPAVNEYAKISWSERRRMIADFKEKQRRDKHAMLEFARDEGREEGRQILLQTARNFKAMGDTAEKIAAATGLSVEEVEEL